MGKKREKCKRIINVVKEDKEKKWIKHGKN